MLLGTVQDKSAEMRRKDARDAQLTNNRVKYTGLRGTCHKQVPTQTLGAASPLQRTEARREYSPEELNVWHTRKADEHRRKALNPVASGGYTAEEWGEWHRWKAESHAGKAAAVLRGHHGSAPSRALHVRLFCLSNQ